MGDLAGMESRPVGGGNTDKRQKETKRDDKRSRLRKLDDGAIMLSTENAGGIGGEDGLWRQEANMRYGSLGACVAGRCTAKT